ncbi:MAG: nicotinate-nucleotide--dimethylbenzimidazole phosphoribosyltransferase, partial [Nocardioidaceae bacterium]
MTDAEERLRDALAAIAPLDRAAMAEAEGRQAQLTKPAGALGVLEPTSVRLTGIQRTQLGQRQDGNIIGQRHDLLSRQSGGIDDDQDVPEAAMDAVIGVVA